MKKTSLIGLGLMLVGGAATAQSSVTLFGVLDAAISGFTNKSEDRYGRSVTISRHELRNSGYNTSRLGFRGTEDLGGGLAAGFWLEAPIGNDDGASALAFTRRSTVSLSGSFGEVRLGRDHTPSYWNNSVFDPMGQVGVGANLLNSIGSVSPGRDFRASTNYPRASNAIGYFLPSSLGGWYGQLMYSFHENSQYDPGSATPPGVNAAGLLNPGLLAATRAGRYAGGRFGYASGPLDVAAAYAEDTTGDNFHAGTTDLTRTANVGASYDFGVLKLFGELSHEQRVRDHAITPIGGGTPDIDLDGYLLGFTIPVGVGLVRGAYSQVRYDLHAPALPNPKSSKVALGYVHNLSKRTALYATVARISNKNGAALTINGGPAFINNATYAPGVATGYDLGIRHAF
ncbi:porin [Variovorax sp. J22P271]|uniref:porin n=1 Tax=Variovorax davisae TaxID=3053515 RepID=UPI002577D862|nr:porin [Variovorax sp. J22P271]MDM0036863.1 porin [Variovorax sp. J22P271]